MQDGPCVRAYKHDLIEQGFTAEETDYFAQKTSLGAILAVEDTLERLGRNLWADKWSRRLLPLWLLGLWVLLAWPD